MSYWYFGFMPVGYGKRWWTHGHWFYLMRRFQKNIDVLCLQHPNRHVVRTGQRISSPGLKQACENSCASIVYFSMLLSYHGSQIIEGLWYVRVVKGNDPVFLSFCVPPCALGRDSKVWRDVLGAAEGGGPLRRVTGAAMASGNGRVANMHQSR